MRSKGLPPRLRPILSVLHPPILHPLPFLLHQLLPGSPELSAVIASLSVLLDLPVRQSFPHHHLVPLIAVGVASLGVHAHCVSAPPLVPVYGHTRMEDRR